jgi:hypothetical protein
MLLAAAAAAQTRPARQELPTFGLSVEPPPGWHSMTHAAMGQAAKWVKPAANLRDVEGFISIDLAAARGKTLTVFAVGLASELGGTLAPQTMEVDHKPARRIDLKATGGNELQLAGVVVVERDGLMAVLSHGAIGDRSVAAEFGEVLASVRWRPFGAPLAHAEFRRQAFPAFNLLFLNVPAAMRSYAVKDPQTQLHLGLHNYVSGQTEFFVNVNLVSSDGTVSFDEIRQRFAATTAAQFKLKEPLKLDDRAGRPLRCASALLEAQPPGAPAGQTAAIKWAIVQVDVKRLVLLVFTVASGRAQDRQAYDQIAERIVESISSAASGKP